MLKTPWLKPQPNLKLGDRVYFKASRRQGHFGIINGMGHTLTFGKDVFLISYVDEYNRVRTRWVPASKVEPDIWYKGQDAREPEYNDTQVAGGV